VADSGEQTGDQRIGSAAREVTLTFPPEAPHRWDADARGSTVDAGAYNLVVAASATDIRSTVRVDVGPGEA
jgi:hypothetical protein